MADRAKPAPLAVLRRASALALSGSARALDRLQAGLGDAARVARFLRGRLEFEPRADDIYVVTYPRSGTTWMQYILYLLTTDDEPAFSHISQVQPWFERTLAVGSRTAADFAALPSPRIFKSHLACSWLPRTGRFVYLSRNATDVAVSYFHFYRSHLQFQGDFDAFFERFLRGELQYRSWTRHVAGWRQRQGDPRILFLEYEQLAADLEACVKQLADFLALPLPASRLARVLAGAQFAQMKQHEDKFDHITELLLERGWHKQSFLRQGRPGCGHAQLSEAQKRRFTRQLARQPWLAAWELHLADFLH